MKKFILVVVLVALAPSFAFADTIGCAAGGLLGGLVGSQIGGGVGQKIFTGLGLVMGCSAGSRIEDGTYGRNAEEVVYVPSQSPYPYPPQYGYGNVVCDKTPKQGMYPPGPGLCNDPDSGGETTYEDLLRRARQRAERAGNYGQPAVYTQPAPVAYAPQQQAVSYSQSIWERPEKRQQKTETKKAVVVGPTISNYREEPMIHHKCKTGNYGHDGSCLINLVPALVKEQKACEADGTKCYQYNAGKWAGIYQRLGNDLLEQQKVVQGGEFSAN